MVTAIPKIVASFILSYPPNKFTSTFFASLLSFKNRSSFLKLANGICPSKTMLAPFHSTSSSSDETVFNHPRSVFEAITKLDDALKLFDEMTQRQPLPSVVQFNQLLQAVTKMKHYSCSIDLFKQMNVLRVHVDVYTS
ncbi:hypothetical protein Lser_V15G13669 [Lactuca serriola]